ncbi:Acyltransferase LovD [Cytospora mali]|uniref:Acyltransferase LovD n=1 Tax=Cytospora mali TaxID=578113 RepID=A0A194W528_CYTMA|nr:Acyltransferase LovD [Valsa mali]
MEKAFEAACAKRTIPGAVLISADMAGSSPFYNSVSLDQDVRPVLHELQDLDIIQAGPDDHGGEGVLSMRRNVAPITLSGIDEIPDSSSPIHQDSLTSSTSPCFRNGDANSQKANVNDPQQASTADFYIHFCMNQARITEMSWRDPSEDPEAQNRPVKYAPVQPALNPDMEDCQGGGGIYASPSEYFKIVHALLLAQDGKTQLLRKSTIDTMFQPQLGTASRKALQAVCQNPWFNRMMGGMPVEARKYWGLGGLLLLDDLPGWRGSGTMTWGGTPNLTWWIDRKAGLGGMYAGQVMPIGDAKCVELNQVFEKEMYVRYQKASEDP